MNLFARSFVDVAMTTMTLATKLRMAAVITGVATTLIGLVLWYRWGRDHCKAGTLKRFVLPAALSVTGTVLAAVGTTLTIAPSPAPLSNTPTVDRAGDSPGHTRTAAARTTSFASSPESEAFAGSTEPTDAAHPATRRKGSLELTDGYAIDLDSRDTDWNITPARYVHFGEKLDLRLFTLLDVHVGIVKATPQADYFDCANSTGRRTEIGHDAFSAEDTFCVQTDEGRWARMVVTTKQTDSTNSTRVKMDVVVWEKHGM